MSRFQGHKYPYFLALLILIQLFFAASSAHALPAFARQTGQNCVACHAGGQFPELTTYGRMFKLTGYTIGTRDVPLAIAGVASYTKSSNPTSDPGFAKDGSAIFQTGSIFLAGKVTDNLGLFAQATYNNYDSQDPNSGQWSGKWASDNFDMRYVDRFISPDRDLIVGLNLNNNPSVADPWNTAPAWIQYVPTQFGVTGPDANPIINQLGGQAAGVGAYAFWNKFLYAEISGYQTANGIFSFLSQGTANTDQTKLKGTNPYVRLTLSHDWGPHSAMAGIFNFNADVYPDNLNPTGPTTHYHDRGLDFQYQYLLDPHTATAQFAYVKENIDNGDITGVATNNSNSLTQWRFKASYVYGAKFGGSIGYMSTTGTADNTLYSSANFSPNTRGWTPELFWMPIQNIRVGAQYFAYTKFDGASNNYDGAGRNAKDNNTFFFYVWGAY
jgi:hypothetical protein